LAATNEARGNHLLGGELYYQYLSGPSSAETYRITLVLYGDCGSVANSNSFNLLMSAVPELDIFDGVNVITTLGMQVDPLNSNIEITPVCPSQVGTTKCTDVNNPLPGIKKFTYTVDFTLTGTSTDWRFAFGGQLGNSLAGRSTILGNILSSGGQIIYLEATLNNTTGPNSSAIYTSVPTPFFCLNQAQGYNLGAVDPNGDALTFGLIPAKLGFANNATYIFPYSATNPIPVVAGTFNFSTSTGQMNFTPNQTMNCVVVNEVEEFRNGVKVGSNMREMTFVILPNCANAAPAPGGMTGVTGGTPTGPTTIQVCQGTTDTIRFGFTAADVNGDSVTLTPSGLPSGSISAVTGNGGLTPSFSFKWYVGNLPTGSHTFYINFKDNGCPLSSNQTIAYTIQIVPFNGTFATGGFAGCKFDNNAKGWIIPQPPTAGNYSFTWVDANQQVVQTTGSSASGDSILHTNPGTYTVQVSNINGCQKNFTVVIPAPAYQAGFQVDTLGCRAESLPFSNTSTSNLGNWEWDFGDGNTSTAANPAHSFSQTGAYEVVLVAKTAAGCTDTLKKTVHISEVILTAGPQDTVCEGETITLFANGALSYQWKPFTGLWCNTCQNPKVTLDSSITYTVTGTDIAGCSDSATVSLTVIPTGMAGNFGDTAICPGDTIRLRADEALSYHWSPPLYISDTTAKEPFVWPGESMVYTFYGEYEMGCRDTTKVKVSVVPKAVLYLEDSVTIYPGETYHMQPGGNALYFHWFPPLGLSDPDISNPVAGPPVNTRYFIKARTEWGCSILDSIDVFVNHESVLDVPNAFTPGSFPNETIKVVRRGQATLKSFAIFNRWGQKMFESSDIDAGWDGKLNGQPQPMGVYVYYLEAFTNTGRKFYKQGNITLIR
ncbi:MAG: T9SS type B sorting domain-containing protein, partial [Sphingobacteriales bacterium]